ncbi:MAG: EAL domain-containing protein [Zoogloea sp.]|nr:EAL domain-containing protein [Zoogloea sp.]
MSTIGEHLAPLAQEFLGRLPRGPQPDRQLHRRPDGRVIGEWFGLYISSVFQPIVEGRDGTVLGHEAFLRSGLDDEGLSPWTLFSTATDDTRLIALDRLARTVHLLNALQANCRRPLFLNVHGRLLAAVVSDHGRAFRRVVDALGASPGEIVIETPVEASAQPDLLAFVLRNYRSNGFRVAVNLASADQWQRIAGVVRADYVKIDRRKLGKPDEASDNLWELSTRLENARLIVTRVEEASDPCLGGDLLRQGYAHGRPQARPADGGRQRS